MKHYISIIILAIFLFSCNGHSKHWETLSQIESYIEEKPDSALVTLEQIDLSELSSNEETAKYALLYSMALDKNFIDKTDFDVLQPAIDYYEDNGSATDLAELLSQGFNMTVTEALDALYGSETYAKLSDPNTGLYFQSTQYVYSFLKNELLTAKFS